MKLTRMSDQLEAPQDPKDFQLPKDQEDLLFMYRDKLKEHLEELKNQDDNVVKIETEFFKKILKDK